MDHTTRRPTTGQPTRTGLLARAPRWLAAGLIGGAALFAAALPGTADAQPRPSIYPVSWQLDLEYRAPQRIVVQVPGRELPTAYYYMVYDVTNNSDEERMFVPQIEMLTRDGRILPANYLIPGEVFRAIRERTRGTDLVSPQQMVGRLLVGQDQGRSSVAIWEEPLTEMGDFTVFIAGLSGEVAPLTDAEGNPLKGPNDEPILLRKTRQLDYRIRGDANRPQDQRPVLLRDDWVMR